MPNPVQIVLNDTDYIQAPEPGQGGPDKDFFEGRDEEFRAHRDRLAAQVANIERSIAEKAFGPATYLRVRLRQDAIAKSHRPNKVLLTADRFACVGAGSIGELFIRAPAVHLRELIRRILSSENHTERRISAQTGVEYTFVTRMRSEVGAIAELEIAPPEQKRPFAAQAATQWLRDPATVGGYIVELFESPAETTVGQDLLGRRRLVETFERVLLGLGQGTLSVFLPQVGRTPVVEVRLLAAAEQARLEDHREIRGSYVPRRELALQDLNPVRHERALDALAAHPLVRRIRLPVRLGLSHQASGKGNSAFSPFIVPSKVDGGRYPLIGVIDTGICAAFDGWVIHRHDFLDAADLHRFHGSFIAGLLIAGQSANNGIGGLEPDGCELVDIPLFPASNFGNHYKRGFDDFLEEMESAIREAVEDCGVRVFNLSINITSPVEVDAYSTYAARLDEIQDRYGVIIVNSAGNLPFTEWRAPWLQKVSRVLEYFARRTEPDTIYMPCESARAIAVGAINPPNTGQIGGAPAVYSRRGPGLRVGTKPDVAHHGGIGNTADPEQTGLRSSNEIGNQCGGAGTSFAAPLVAKSLAMLDVLTERTLAPRTLRAFLIHGCETPEPLRNPRLRDLARQFTGFGVPIDAVSMLETDDYGISLVFESRLTAGQPRPAILRFGFNWPSCLVDDETGACRGRIRMTLVYDPPVDPAFGAEFARVNLDAHLQQRQAINRKDGTPSWQGEVAQGFLPNANGLAIPERTLINYGLKWWPTKRYQRTLPAEGVGKSSEWRLQIDSLVRAEATFPTEGVPFSVILTIEDEERRRPVFRQLLQELQNRNVNVNDVRVAQRVRQRGRR